MEMKSVRTDKLDIAYLENGPKDGPTVLCLHGFPDTAESYREVMELLAIKGYRTLAPFVRGFLPTKFLSEKTSRAGDFAALGQDALDFVDALDLKDLMVIGQDWGSPTAEVVASFRPQRIKRLLKLNWHGVFSMNEMMMAQEFKYSQFKTLWYVFLLNTKMGEMILDYDRQGFAKALWAEWSSSWSREERENALLAVSRAFEHDDFKKVTLSAYRANISESEIDPDHIELRKALMNMPSVQCETRILVGEDDGIDRSPLSDTALAMAFKGGYSVARLDGVGHFPQREAPQKVIDELLR
ncbi:alpha/beta fold hydrolase [Cohnella suwonensis]|uniref:Alpha/beta fold hydrolase n=1 Tax=Cohnella suwonensis TaxID=696072 RepID=A0ABW0M247_9BACL